MSAISALAAAPAATTDDLVQSNNKQTVAQATEATPPKATQPESPQPETPQPVAMQPQSSAPAAPNVVPADASATTPSERDQAVSRIRQSALPPALRERLAAVVEAGQSPSLDVAACLEALEQTLPDFLRSNRESAIQPAHPNGDAFFQSSDGELSDAEAEALAQRQLSRSGLLRGQRVKVAD